jgi:two-component system chemotaxis response regulator CheY
MEATKKILVVDDSATFRRLVIFHLQKLPQIEIVEAASGLEAVEKLSLQRFDLVITDLIMPGMDGLKLITYIKSAADLKDTYTIIVTTKGQEQDQKRGMELGASAYISKPITAGELLNAVKKGLKL